MAINKDFIIPDAGLQVNGAAILSSTLGVNGAVTVANTISVGNTTVTGNVNVSVAANVGGAIRAGGLITGAAGADITGTANASVAINVGANVNLSASAVNVGNSSSNTVVTQTSVNTGNSTLFTTIGQATGLFGNSTVNTAIGQATANFGNSTVNTQITSSTFRTGNSSAYTNVSATALTTNGTLSVTGAATFSNNVTVAGNFTVSGTTTFVNTATLNVSDNIITLNSDLGAVAPSENAGVEVNRGSSANVSLIWNETADKWQVTEDGTNFFNIHRKGTDVVLGTDTSGDYVASITGGDGLTGSGTGEGSTPTLAVGAANGITVSADAVGVLAGTELTSNASGVHHNDITRTNTTNGNTSPNYAGTFTAVDSVTTNARGHVTGVNTKTVTMPSSNNTTYDMLAVANTTASNAILRLIDSGSVSDNVFFVGTDEVVTSSNATHIVIDHADVTRSDGTSAASPASGGTFTAVDSVTTNARGHVSAINVKTVTLPVDPNTTYDLLAVANTTTSNAILRLQNSSNANDNVFFVGTDEVVTSSNATHVIIDHADVSRSDGTSAASPASGGTFTAVDSVTTNARGHVTAINVKTVTLPVDPNTTYDLLAVANTSASNAMIRLQNSSNANDTIFFVGTDEVVTSSNATHVVIDHADVTRSDGTSAASPVSGGSFTAVDSVTTNARGHVTAINVKTVTLPIDPNTDTTYTSASVANTVANQGRARLTSSSNANTDVLFVGQDELTVTSNASAIYIDHNDVARSDGTSTASPASGGSFTAVDSVTTNARGHVTAINVKTVTLPVDPDTNTTYDLLAVANTSASNAILRLQNSSNANDNIFFVGTDEVVTSSNATHIIIDHADVSRSDGTSSTSPASGGTFTAVDSVTTNARGHVTAINVKTVTLPVDPNTTYTGANGIALNSTQFYANVGGSLVANASGIHMPSVATAGSSTGGISAITIDAQGRVTSVTGSAGYVTSSGVTSVSGTAGRITSSGTATPTIDLATAGAGAATYSSGISAITVDAYGRVTGVTGTANYLTSAVTSVSGTAGRITSSGTATPTIDLATAGAGAATYSSGISAITVDAYGRVTGVTGTANYLTSVTNISGNAGTATALQTARTINGQSFDGTANITVTDSTKLPLAGGTMSGNITFAVGQTWPTFNQNTTGSAGTFTSTSQNSQFNSIGVGTAASTSAGEIRASSDITAYYSSDKKFKENVRPIDNALDKVEAIGGKYFDWTDEYIASRGGEDGYFIRKSDFGVIAQDVESVLPEAVRTRDNGSLAVDYDKLCALAFQAIKELNQRVADLESRIENGNQS